MTDTNTQERNEFWINGWGVFRASPWFFHGIFETKMEAEEQIKIIGNGYQVAYGQHRVGSDDFVFTPLDQGGLNYELSKAGASITENQRRNAA